MSLADVEFSISQYLDGTLSAAERVELEARLQNEPENQALLDEHRAITAALRQLPLPEIRWDRLAESIAREVERTEAPVPQSFKIFRIGFGIPLGLAASVMVAAGVAFHVYFGSASSVAPRPQPLVSRPQEVAVITGPQADAAGGPSQLEVSIGPGKAVADASQLARYADDVVVRPSHVLVASGITTVEDTSTFPN